MPKVSVVVATYDRTTELAMALESLGTQSYLDFEIILVDDNADLEKTGKVKKIVAEFRQKCPKVKIHHIVNSENLGSAEARNVGIDVSCGKYVTFLDDDDVYLPQKIENQVEFMEKQNLDFSITDLELFDKQDRLIDKRYRTYLKDTTKEALLTYHLKHHLTGTDTLMFKLDYLQKIGNFPPINVGDEFYLMLRAIEGGGKFGHLSKCDVKAYVHVNENSLSSGDGKVRGENELYAFKKKYFHQLTAKDVRYIKMRHYAVLAFAFLRMKKYFLFSLCGILSFICSPVSCIYMALNINK